MGCGDMRLDSIIMMVVFLFFESFWGVGWLLFCGRLLLFLGRIVDWDREEGCCRGESRCREEECGRFEERKREGKFYS